MYDTDETKPFETFLTGVVAARPIEPDATDLYDIEKVVNYQVIHAYKHLARAGVGADIMSHDDMTQTAYLGYYIAKNKFDSAKGPLNLTYVSKYMKAAIWDEIKSTLNKRQHEKLQRVFTGEEYDEVEWDLEQRPAPPETYRNREEIMLFLDTMEEVSRSLPYPAGYVFRASYTDRKLQKTGELANTLKTTSKEVQKIKQNAVIDIYAKIRSNKLTTEIYNKAKRAWTTS